MNFIEKLFHVAPDDGSGLLEFVIVLVVLVFPVLLYVMRINKLRGIHRALSRLLGVKQPGRVL